jgi:DNA-binding winged helix-turn-helix (wHTH) protein
MAQGPSSTTPSGAEDFYEFGIYRLEVSSRSLFRSGEFVPLAPKVFDTLLILVKEAGRVVTKDELMQQVWPDAFVEEGSIANNVSTLRKLLNADFEGEGPIATVPKRGYRFTADLRLRSATGEIAVHAPAAPPVTAEIPQKKAILAIHRSRQTGVLLLASGLVVVLAIVAYIYFVSGRQVISAKDTIVITDFTNKTGDAVFDDALKQALIF